MIKYNCAYRSPLSYDKHALNVLELHNDTNRLKNNTVDNGTINNARLKQLKTKFDSLFSAAIDNSLSEQLFIVQQYLR